ncbi:MAG: nucleotidyltransferase domain-containing protein [Ardenticatenaceae bacterium]|nr:nucleotidyltransferase domain-containing protein [Ardenticatenaceae bacterium]
MTMADLTPREYHARREAARLQEREALRRQRLDAARTAIRQLAPTYPAIQAVYLFGSILQIGRFTSQSDIDVALSCDDVAVESKFWRELEAALEWDVDVRPLQHPITQAVNDYGECVYERKSPHS